MQKDYSNNHDHKHLGRTWVCFGHIVLNTWSAAYVSVLSALTYCCYFFTAASSQQMNL